MTEKNDEVKLKKNVGLLSGTALIVGTMIGSGVFVSPKGVVFGAGSVGMSLVLWTLCGLLSLMGALTYAELGAAIPLSGGEHAYLMFTFKPFHKCLGLIPAYLYAWIGVLLLRPTMFAIMALSLASYATQPFFSDCEDVPLILKKLVSICVMVLLAAINCYSVKSATVLQNITTVIKLVAVATITVGGFYVMATDETASISEGFEGTSKDMSTIALAFYNGLWAYDGWNNLNFITEELKNPNRNLPLAILFGLPLTTACYVCVNIGYFAVLTKEEIVLSDTVAMLWGERVLGAMAWVMPVFVVLSCFGAANGALFSSGRLCYVAAREGHLANILSFIHKDNLTPLPSLVFTTLIAMLLVLAGNLGQLIEFFGFAAWLFYGLTAFSLLVLRYTQPNLPRPYKVPIFIPILVVIVSVYLVLSPIITSPSIGYVYVIAFIFFGVLLYFPMVHNGYTFRVFARITKCLQILFQVVPTE